MATFIEQSDLVYRTVQDLSSLAEATYNEARNTLDDLSNGVTELPLSYINPDIGAETVITWGADITPITASTVPTYVEDYIATLPADAPTVPEVTVTLTDLEALAPTLDPLETPDAPTGIGILEFAALPTLGTLPTIDTVVPVVDVAVLEAAFEYDEPVYTPELKSDLKAELLRVLGGDLGIPQAYWDALWAKSAGDLARQQVGRLRNARNRGAASYWALPGEAVLSASRLIQDEGARSLQINRLQQAVTQATMAREDFWAAVEKGITFEAQWIGMFETMAARSLAAAEQLVNVKIQVHNANVNRFNLLLEQSKTEVEIDRIEIDAVLRVFEGQLKGAEVDIQQQKARIEKYQTEWQAKNQRESTLVQAFGESVRAWSSQIDAEIKAAKFPLERAQIEAQIHGTLFGAVGAMAQATQAVVGAEVESKKAVLASEVANLERDKTHATTTVQIGQLTQAAQEAKVRMDIAQAQWLGGQSNDIKQRIAELAWGYAQATMAASDVSMGSNVGISLSGAA